MALEPRCVWNDFNIHIVWFGAHEHARFGWRYDGEQLLAEALFLRQGGFCVIGFAHPDLGDAIAITPLYEVQDLRDAVPLF